MLAFGLFQYSEERKLRLSNEARKLEIESQRIELERKSLEQIEQARLQEEKQKEHERQLETEKLRLARQEMERKAAEQKRFEETLRINSQRYSLASKFAEQAGSQLMNAVGGGRDLITQVSGWDFDENRTRFRIKLNAQFHGAFVRANFYSITGVLIVNEDGSNPEFSRTYANDRFQKLESRLAWVGTVIVLSELASN